MKPVELARIGNLRQGFLARGATLILPAVFSILALGGVTARPAFEISEARAALRRSEQRLELYETELALHERYEREGILDGSQELLAHARERIPDGCSNVVAHGVLRLASAKVGIELTQLQVTLDKPLELPALDVAVVAREVAIGGRARVAELLALLHQLRALGFPTCVFDVSLRRSDPSDRHFEFHLNLGLLHYAHDPRSGDSAAPSQDQP